MPDVEVVQGTQVIDLTGLGIVVDYMKTIGQTADDNSSAVSELQASYVKLLDQIVTVMTDVQRVLNNINTAKADKPICLTSSVPATWQTNGSDSEDYPCYIDLSHETIKAYHKVEVIIAPASMKTAQYIRLCPSCKVTDGKIRLYAKLLHSEGINVQIWISPGAETDEIVTSYGSVHIPSGDLSEDAYAVPPGALNLLVKETEDAEAVALNDDGSGAYTIPNGYQSLILDGTKTTPASESHTPVS